MIILGNLRNILKKPLSVNCPKIYSLFHLPFQHVEKLTYDSHLWIRLIMVSASNFPTIIIELARGMIRSFVPVTELDCNEEWGEILTIDKIVITN